MIDPFLKLLNQAKNLSDPNEDPRIVVLAAYYAMNSCRAVKKKDLVRAWKEAPVMAKYRPETWQKLTDIVCHGKKMPTCASGEA